VKRILSGLDVCRKPGLHGVEHPVYDIWLTDCKGPDQIPSSARNPNPPKTAPPPPAQKRSAAAEAGGAAPATPAAIPAAATAAATRRHNSGPAACLAEFSGIRASTHKSVGLSMQATSALSRPARKRTLEAHTRVSAKWLEGESITGCSSVGRGS